MTNFCFCPACGAYLPTSLSPGMKLSDETFDDHMRTHHKDWVWTGKFYGHSTKYAQNQLCNI